MLPIAQTFSAGAALDGGNGIPKTGIESVDRAIAVAFLTITVLSSLVVVARQVRARVQDLMGAARPIIAPSIP